MPVSPNYAFEKRQRELAKKKKLEEKKARKRDAAAPTPDDTPALVPGSESAVPTASPKEAKAEPRVHRRRSP